MRRASRRRWRGGEAGVPPEVARGEARAVPEVARGEAAPEAMEGGRLGRPGGRIHPPEGWA
ncbi:hypothetical protein SSTG_02257 [Streptomyces sp. e14]|nr:hypothetical protein SSTG_02257 [Streptomyces sp. e14]